MPPYLTLALAIAAEVAATTALKSADGFTRLVPSAFVIVGYATALYLLSLTLRSIPVGVAYAIWSGAGTTLIVAISWVAFGQKLDWAALVGIALIISGTLVLHLMSSALSH